MGLTGGASLQRQARQLAEQVGIAPALKAARRQVVPSARRNQRDNRHLHLLLSFLLAEDANCIDVGAHSGEVLRQIVQYAPKGRHIAYEPLPHLAEQLVAEFPQVDVRRAALSDEAGTSSFTHVVSRPAYSGFAERGYPGQEETQTIEVRVETLDEAVPADLVPTLIKVDVEGAELQVLRGARGLLSRHRPYVVFEFGAGSAPFYGTTPDDVYTLLHDEVGLRIFDFEGAGPYSAAEFRTAYRTGDRFNFLAHP